MLATKERDFTVGSTGLVLDVALTKDKANAARMRASASQLADESSTLQRVREKHKTRWADNWLYPKERAMVKFEVAGHEQLGRS